MTRVKQLLSVGLVLLLVSFSGQTNSCSNWPAWDTFRNRFMSDDGRIIDYSSQRQITTSEGQSYALFFALVANDKVTFDKLLNWTNNNLTDSNVGQQLPAWTWGKAVNGDWKILDKNSASDADVWISYALLEAGRLWQRPDYQKLGKQLAERILQNETDFLPKLGLSLLPAAYGFHPQANLWRLNPSYSPIQLLRYLSTINPQWAPVANSSARLINHSATNGYAPDWVEYQLGKGLQPDKATNAKGSYDAIRVYLWLGMLHQDDPIKQSLLKQLSAMKTHIEKHAKPAETINTVTGQTNGTGSIGFSAALLPFLASSNSQSGLVSQLSRLLKTTQTQQPDNYYDQVLSLFGLGWHNGYYRFAANGQLTIPVVRSCP